MNNFLGAFIVSVLHILSYVIFLIVFTQIEFDFVMFIYAIIIFILHALIHLIALSFNKNTSHVGWTIGFIVINIVVLVGWFYGFFFKIL